MSGKDTAHLKTWRDVATDLHRKGVSENDIIDRVLRDFSSNFKTKASARNTISRYLHSKYNPANYSSSFADDVVEMKGSIRKKAERSRDRDAVLRKAATDIIIEEIKSLIASRPHYEPKRYDIRPVSSFEYSEETMVIMFSDVQAGTYISKEATGGLNEFNWSILEKQFDVFFEGIEEIVVRQKKASVPIEHAHIHFLGDIVEGWDIFKGQTNAIDHDIASQLLDIVDLIADFLDKLRSLFKHIHIVGVPGNHGRIGKRGENLHYVNYDYIVYMIVAKLLKDYPEFTWQVSKSWWQVDTIYNYNFLLFHGDDIRSWQGIPYYGIDRTAKDYRELLEILGTKYDYLEIGHFHKPTELSGVTTEKFVNGCWPGGTIYSMKGLGTANTPLQKVFLVHPKLGVTYRCPVKLIV